MAYLNVSTYGSVLTSGYTVQTVVDELATKVTDNNVVSADFWDNILTRIPFAQYIFPFGIHEKNILTNVVGYGFWLYFWLAIPSLIGLFLMWQKNNLRERLYVLITAFVFVWLSIVYGSWSFNDNPDPSIITLGNSYARYWLPIFVLLSLPAAIALEKLSKVRFDKHKMIFIASLLLIVGLSAMRVFSGQDGFINSRNNLRIMMEKKKVVLENTPDEAIIIADMADKYLWPDRKVITPLRSDATYNILPIAVDCRPVFYFGITLPDKDLKYLKEVKLASDQLYFKPIISINDETLYKVMKNENEK
ncbi:hypothetical protein D6827_04080 [Candidatus Parcubacteria bacterium]|nr:MAG: hypothetical protein D6827_04080 [Candidatus Parcubacteria bacterium]